MEEKKSLIQQIIRNKTIVFLVTFSLFVFILLILLPLISLFNDSSDQTQQGSPSPTPIPGFSKTREISKYARLQKTVIGQTTAPQLEKNTTILNKTQLSSGATKYVIDSDIPGQVNDVYTVNGKVVFEATPIFTKELGPLPYIVQYINENGAPEEIVEGNERWGWHTSAYIYASKGIMLIANTFTSEVYEIIRFSPMSLSAFKQAYPEYIEPEGPKDHGHFPVREDALRN